jgi:hypothetical protein
LAEKTYGTTHDLGILFDFNARNRHSSRRCTDKRTVWPKWFSRGSERQIPGQQRASKSADLTQYRSRASKRRLSGDQLAAGPNRRSTCHKSAAELFAIHAAIESHFGGNERSTNRAN